MAAETPLDSSLDAVDRARYAVFELLRERGEVTEGEAAHYLLTRLAENPPGEQVPGDLPALLRSVGRQVGSHRWRFDAERVTEYKQLRLFFRPSRADELRERIAQRGRAAQGRQLEPDMEGLALLHDRLREANQDTRAFEQQYDRLRAVLQTVLLRLKNSYGEQIERVDAVGDWAREGIDLRNLPYEDIVLDIVLRAADRPFTLYRDVAENVFRDLDDKDVFVQFRLVTLPEWQHAEVLARVEGRAGALGISLLSRT